MGEQEIMDSIGKLTNELSSKYDKQIQEEKSEFDSLKKEIDSLKKELQAFNDVNKSTDSKLKGIQKKLTTPKTLEKKLSDINTEILAIEHSLNSQKDMLEVKYWKKLLELAKKNTHEVVIKILLIISFLIILIFGFLYLCPYSNVYQTVRKMKLSNDITERECISRKDISEIENKIDELSLKIQTLSPITVELSNTQLTDENKAKESQ